MAGTKAGGIKAAKTNKERHGENFFKDIGRVGGANGTTGGFRSDLIGEDGLTGRERARIAGAKGGRKSKRGPAKLKEEIQPSDEILRSIDLDLEEKPSRLISNVLGRLRKQR